MYRRSVFQRVGDGRSVMQKAEFCMARTACATDLKASGASFADGRTISAHLFRS